MTHDLPKSLIDAVKNNNLIPFIGAGISMGIKDNENNPIFKSWTNSLSDAVQILKNEHKIHEATNVESELNIQPIDYLAIASKIHKYLNSHWNKFLVSTFERDFDTINKNSLKIAKEILKINNLVITTNYDNVLKWACENKNDLIEWDKKAIHGQVKSLKSNPEKQTIWYLHGKISNPDDIVFTKESYEETYRDNSGAIEVLKYHLLTKSFIFCGFSLDDPYIKMQLEKLKDIFGTNLSNHFMIVKKGQKQDFSFLGDIYFLEVDDYEGSYLKLLQQINDLKTASTTQQTFNAPTHIQTTPKTPFFNVPFESKKDDFVGIEGKLEEIYSTLVQSRKLSIGQVAKFEGMGGLGKTQLAVEYAHEYKEFYTNGVIWLTMDQNLDEQLLTFAKQYSLVNQNLDIKEQLHSVKHIFKLFDNMLLIYDNTNGLEDIEQEFLPKSPTNQILITTRNPIQGYTSIELQTLDLENSKKLLEIESGKPISDPEIGFVKELCEQLDGLPLALEMAGAYVKYLDLSWEKYLSLYTNQSIELLNKSKLPESFTKHENNIANTLTISQKIIDDTPRLKEILQLLSYGANEPIDDELIINLLSCNDSDIIEAISIGIKLKYIKKSSQGYTIHRLLKEVWKTQEQLEDTFVDEVAKNLSNYIAKIKDEFLNLSKIEIANLFSAQWINYLADNDTKAILLAYKAYVDFYKGNYQQALMIVEEANVIIEKKDSGGYAEILTYLGSLHRELGHMPIAKGFYENSFEIIKKLYPNQDHPKIANSLQNLGSIWNDLGDYHKAKDFNEKSFEMRKRLYPHQDHPDIASSLNSLGFTLDSLGDYNKAKDFYDDSFEMRKRLYPNQDHPNIAISLNNIGAILDSLGDYNKAKDFYENSFEMRKRLYSNQDHPDIATSLNNLGFIFDSLGDYNKAKNFYEDSFEMNKRLYPNQDHPSAILSMLNLSVLLCKNPVSRKQGLELLKQYKKIVTTDTDLQKIIKMVKHYEANIGRDKSKRKKR